MISFTQLSHKLLATNRKKWIWIGLVLAALPAVQIYYVQELLAALFLVLFLSLGVSVTALAIYLLVWAIKPIIAWAAPNVGRLLDGGVDAVKGVIASPAWAQALPRHVRREKLNGDEKNQMVYLRSTALKLDRAYRGGLRAGAAALTIGLSVQKRVSSRLGPWLRERVTLRRPVILRIPGHLFVRIRRMASPHSTVFPRRPRKNRPNYLPSR